MKQLSKKAKSFLGALALSTGLYALPVVGNAQTASTTPVQANRPNMAGTLIIYRQNGQDYQSPSTVMVETGHMQPVVLEAVEDAQSNTQNAASIPTTPFYFNNVRAGLEHDAIYQNVPVFNDNGIKVSNSNLTQTSDVDAAEVQGRLPIGNALGARPFGTEWFGEYDLQGKCDISGNKPWGGNAYALLGLKLGQAALAVGAAGVGTDSNTYNMLETGPAAELIYRPNSATEFSTLVELMNGTLNQSNGTKSNSNIDEFAFKWKNAIDNKSRIEFIIKYLESTQNNVTLGQFSAEPTVFWYPLGGKLTGLGFYLGASGEKLTGGLNGTNEYGFGLKGGLEFQL